jgi:PAS domain S-box-containing protein
MSKLRRFIRKWALPRPVPSNSLPDNSSRQDPDRELTTEKLRQSEERFQVVVESIQDYAIYILDPNGIVISWNSGAQRIKGYEAEEIIGKHFSRFYTADDIRVNKPMRNLQIAAVQGKYEDESLRVRKDGSVFWVSVLITPIRDHAGKLTAFVKVVRDITERKKSEERLQESERLANLGTTAAVFAHEIANPLNGLSTSLQIVQELLDESDYANPLLRETINAANVEIERLASLLKDYRSLARPQTLNIEATDLQRLIQEVLATNLQSYNDAGVQLRTEFAEDLPLIPLDRQKMKQVVLNLCKNAIEAMPKGGLLHIRSYRNPDSVIVEFSDTGQGIPQGFDPFHLFKTTKPYGTGLGLPIVQQILSDHHGSVDYVTEPGKGTTFRVSLALSATH